MQLLSELRRRRVIRVAGLYAVVAWITTEVSATVLPLLRVPEYFITGIVITLIIVFPIAMILAWVYDFGPAGIEKTPELSESAQYGERPGALFHVVLLILAMLVFGYALYYFGQTRALQAIERRSIAVLPFENLSSDPSKDYFSDGVSEEILNMLAKVDGLSVAARTSSFAFRDKRDDIRTIGSELGVDTVLEGSVRWADDGERVRITAQLIDASSGYHLWSDNFDRDLQDIFEVQSEIAKAIVDILRIKLGTESTEWVAPTSNALAYDYYLRGRRLLNERRVAQIRESIDYFHKATARDPAFAAALAAMAVAYVSLPIYSDEPVEQLHAMSEKLVQRVLVLSPELAEAHAVRAWLALYKGEWSRAEFGYFAATSMDPNDVTTRVWYAEFLVAAGKLTQAKTQADRAIELENDNPLTQASAATVAMVRGDNDACIKHAAVARELGFARTVNLFEGICQARAGKISDATAALRAALGPLDEISAIASLAEALATSDSLQEAAQVAMANEADWNDDPWAVWVAAAAGETDAAFTRLRREFSGKGHLHMQLLWSPEASELRSDPRFLELMRESGVMRIWRNDLPDLCRSEDEDPFSCH